MAKNKSRSLAGHKRGEQDGFRYRPPREVVLLNARVCSAAAQRPQSACRECAKQVRTEGRYTFSAPGG